MDQKEMRLMSDYHALEFGKFVDDQGMTHTMVPSAAIAAVPAARAAAERHGREVRFDFLDDRAVHWMLYQRREETSKAGAQGCLLAVPVFVLGFGAWPFWDLVASQKSREFQIGFVVVDALLLLVLGGLILLWRLRDLRDESLRNTRCRARLYRKIVGIARSGGADIPRLYPYYGMYATSRKFFPEAPDRPIPAKDQTP
ncbi:hypothetical protein ADL00_25415 [Streptomyces sp. AS58]|uniref:Uncharacterized protein n=2 Tax=Streptomyces TaxID=1883 RepID=A0A2Z4IZJ1_9ACTN|nr:hypothetical protein DN051_17505 [Streptomyces cadmiisoli]KOV59951.1 hypothetical protein ADL00_25415 [Streptomyces sp. AS58]